MLNRMKWFLMHPPRLIIITTIIIAIITKSHRVEVASAFGVVVVVVVVVYFFARAVPIFIKWKLSTAAEHTAKVEFSFDASRVFTFNFNYSMAAFHEYHRWVCLSVSVYVCMCVWMGWELVCCLNAMRDTDSSVPFAKSSFKHIVNVCDDT